MAKKSEKKTINKTNSVMDLTRKLLGVNVKHRFTVKTDEKSEQVFTIDASIEFSECTIEDVLQDAIKTIIIREQNRLRKRDESELKEMAKTPITINPADKGRRGTIGIDRALKQVLANIGTGKFTDEQLQKLISELGK